MSELEKIDIESIKTQFTNMKSNPPQLKSKKDIIADLATDIKELLKLGYTIPQILDVLNNNGMGLKEGTLKNYLAQASKRVSQAQPANTPAAPPPPSRRSRKKKDPLKPHEVYLGNQSGNHDVSDGQIVIASDNV